MDSYDLLDLFHNKEMVKVCAPMVRYSKQVKFKKVGLGQNYYVFFIFRYQFRTLVREYEADLCFTPMILADSFCQSQKARDNEFIVNTGQFCFYLLGQVINPNLKILVDQPLVIQFAAHTVHDFVGAAYLASP